jgi:hypothetical protein
VTQGNPLEKARPAKAGSRKTTGCREAGSLKENPGNSGRRVDQNNSSLALSDGHGPVQWNGETSSPDVSPFLFYLPSEIRKYYSKNPVFCRLNNTPGCSTKSNETNSSQNIKTC